MEETKALGRKTLFECHFKVNLIKEVYLQELGWDCPRKDILFIFSSKPRGENTLKIHCDM